MSIGFYNSVGFSQSPQPNVRITTEPPINKIIPFEAEASTLQSPVKLTLQAVDATGKALENAKVNLKIFTPPKNPWFTTDFPIVEGTKLLDIEAIAPKGQLQFQQILPIRGNYQLQVNVTPITPNAFTPIKQNLNLSVPENGVKYRNFAILAVILLLVGLGGGWVIGGRQETQPGEIAPQRVRLLLSGAAAVAIVALLAVNLSAEMAQSQTSHGDHHHHTAADSAADHHTSAAEPETDNYGIVRQQGLEVQLLGDNSATVGEPAKLQVQVLDQKTKQPVSDVLLNIKTTALEDGWVPFAYQGIPDATGKLSWEQQFFDGAPHNIQVEVSPQPNASRQFSPVRVQKNVDVEGVAPPLSIRLIVLAYLTGIIIVGLLVGLQLKQKLRLQY
ncbi:MULTISPECIES: hypothetical protein [unclassified Nostoc]|uniref:hypothetical protein n=1 Tax=unclassified Nostoc TaxID=2593658 RepID=UPI001F55069B|nr:MULTISPECIES: hypothetical protein [unclassified Nostoc]